MRRRTSNAYKLAHKRITNTVGSVGNLDADEQRVLARGYIEQSIKLRRLRRQVTLLSRRLLGHDAD